MNMTRRVNRPWVQTELIPFLDTVFFTRTIWESWNEMIARAERNIDDVKFGRTYRTDFPASIEALRLLLVNPRLTTYDERKPYEGLQHCKTQDSVTIFVRHAINHGLYHLASHGNSPCREFPRGEAMETLLPFYASFDDVKVTEEKGYIPSKSNHGQYQQRKRKAQDEIGVGHGENYPYANGQQYPQRARAHFWQPYHYDQPTQYHQPFQTHLGQPTYYGQPIRNHQAVQTQLGQPFHYGQPTQYHQPVQTHLGQPSHYGQPTQYHSQQAHHYGQQVHRSVHPQGQHTHNHRQGVYQPVQPHVQPHSHVQQVHQPLQHHSQQTYNSGQWTPHQAGGWHVLPSHPVPPMGYTNVNGAPQTPDYQMNNWPAAANTNAYYTGLSGNVPTFQPQQGVWYPNGNAG